jgi:hypothetical protein
MTTHVLVILDTVGIVILLIFGGFGTFGRRGGP